MAESRGAGRISGGFAIVAESRGAHFCFGGRNQIGCSSPGGQQLTADFDYSNGTAVMLQGTIRHVTAKLMPKDPDENPLKENKSAVVAQFDGSRDRYKYVCDRDNGTSTSFFAMAWHPIRRIIWRPIVPGCSHLWHCIRSSMDALSFLIVELLRGAPRRNSTIKNQSASMELRIQCQRWLHPGTIGLQIMRRMGCLTSYDGHALLVRVPATSNLTRFYPGDETDLQHPLQALAF